MAQPLPPRKPPSATPELLGGRWDVHKLLGGNMGTVMLLVERSTGTLQAAKTPRVDRDLDPDSRLRFAAEARNWLSLGRHENVVEAFFLEDVSYRGTERPFLFLEFVEGRTLHELLRQEQRLTLPVALDVATGIAWGMSHAHGEQRPGPSLVHRDLKPDNVFLTRARVVKVSDFGIARALDRPEDIASGGDGVGTPFYAAPEQMRDARLADRRSDIYSYGAVLYEMLTGTPPFPAADLSTLVFQVLREPPPPIRPLRPDVPEELEALVLRCLEKKPADRPRSFGEILARISEIREDDALWAVPEGARSCHACGWLSRATTSLCPLCDEPLGEPHRYAPVSPRAPGTSPTLGRSDRAGLLRISGVEFRPRVPRAGEQMVATVLLENDGGEPVEDVVVPHVRPDRDAFSFGSARRRDSFRGTVPPTAPGAPLRVSWTLVPLVAGRFRLRGARAFFRAADGTRRSTRSGAVTLDVVENEIFPLVGRQAELKVLSDCVDATLAGTPTIVLLLAQPGVGKSRLTRETWRRAREQGFTRGRGRCLDRGSDVRGALKEALRHLLHLPTTQVGPGQIADALVEMLGAAGEAEPGLLPFLVDELLSRPLARGMSPAHLWSRALVALARRQPLLLVLEDVHRDPEVAAIAFGSVQLARRHAVPLLVVTTSRPELEDGPGADLVRLLELDSSRSEGTCVLRVGPLGADAVEQVLREEFEPNDFDRTAPWLFAEVASLSGANPMFLIELVRALKSGRGATQGLVLAEAGRWTAGTGLTRERLREVAPSRVGALVLSRVEEFPAHVQACLRAASVLGDVFELGLLRALLGEPAELADMVRTLDAGAVLREFPGPPAHIRFREPVLPEIVARDLAIRDPDEFQRLHGAAADLLAAMPGARSVHALRLGRHLRAAGREAEGFPVLVQAARRLIERQSYQRAALVLGEAASFVESGQQLSPSIEVEFDLLRGEALRFTGDFPGALAAYGRLVRSGRAAAAGERTLALVHGKMGKVHETLGQLGDALYCSAVALALREELGDERDLAMSLANVGALNLLRGQLDRAREYQQRASEQAARSGAGKALGRALLLGARIDLAHGRLGGVRLQVRGALRQARRAADRRGTAAAREVLALVNLREGRAQRALLHLRRALRVRQEVGDQAAVAATWTLLGRAHERRGDLSQALADHRRSVELARRIVLQRVLCIGLGGIAHVSLLLGRPRRAGEALQEAFEEDACFVEVSERTILWTTRATYLRAIGDQAGAVSALERAHAIADASHDVEALARAHLASARHARAVGERDRALVAARAGAEIQGISQDLAVALLALVAELGDDPDAAARTLVLAESAEDPRVLAVARAADARVALGAGRAEYAAALLRRAAGAAVQCGQRDPIVLRVLIDQARALQSIDPAAAAAAARRAAEMSDELLARGYSAAPGTGFPTVAAASPVIDP